MSAALVQDYNTIEKKTRSREVSQWWGFERPLNLVWEKRQGASPSKAALVIHQGLEEGEKVQEDLKGKGATSNS